MRPVKTLLKLLCRWKKPHRIHTLDMFKCTLIIWIEVSVESLIWGYYIVILYQNSLEGDIVIAKSFRIKTTNIISIQFNDMHIYWLQGKIGWRSPNERHSEKSKKKAIFPPQGKCGKIKWTEMLGKSITLYLLYNDLI